MLVSDSTDARLHFVDAQAFVAGGTLKAFNKEFGGIENGSNGLFKYEVISINNYYEVLSSTWPFTHMAFYGATADKVISKKTNNIVSSECSKVINKGAVIKGTNT